MKSALEMGPRRVTWPIHFVCDWSWTGVATQMKTSRSGSVMIFFQLASVKRDSVSYVDANEPGEAFNAFKRRSRYSWDDASILSVLEMRWNE